MGKRHEGLVSSPGVRCLDKWLFACMFGCACIYVNVCIHAYHDCGISDQVYSYSR